MVHIPDVCRIVFVRISGNISCLKDVLALGHFCQATTGLYLFVFPPPTVIVLGVFMILHASVTDLSAMLQKVLGDLDFIIYFFKFRLKCIAIMQRKSSFHGALFAKQSFSRRTSQF